MPEGNSHGKNLIGTSQIELGVKLLILRVFDLLANDKCEKASPDEIDESARSPGRNLKKDDGSEQADGAVTASHNLEQSLIRNGRPSLVVAHSGGRCASQPVRCHRRPIAGQRAIRPAQTCPAGRRPDRQSSVREWSEQKRFVCRRPIRNRTRPAPPRLESDPC